MAGTHLVADRVEDLIIGQEAVECGNHGTDFKPASGGSLKILAKARARSVISQIGAKHCSGKLNVAGAMLILIGEANVAGAIDKPEIGLGSLGCGRVGKNLHFGLVFETLEVETLGNLL